MKRRRVSFSVRLSDRKVSDSLRDRRSKWKVKGIRGPKGMRRGERHAVKSLVISYPDVTRPNKKYNDNRFFGVEIMHVEKRGDSSWSRNRPSTPSNLKMTNSFLFP